MVMESKNSDIPSSVVNKRICNNGKHKIFFRSVKSVVNPETQAFYEIILKSSNSFKYYLSLKNCNSFYVTPITIDEIDKIIFSLNKDILTVSNSMPFRYPN